MTALTGLTASFAAEVLKLRKRPATWALGGLLAAAIVLLRYVLLYVISRQAPGPGVSAQEIAMLKEVLLPRNLVPTMLNILPSIGGAIALILGALVTGSEYGWTTLKTILTQRPGRAAGKHRPARQRWRRAGTCAASPASSPRRRGWR